MINPGQRPTVLIVDPDLGLNFWLGAIFNEAGCLPIPALDCGHAVSITEELGTRLAVLVVNPEMFGVAWMIHTLRRLHGPFRIISLIDDDVDGARSISDEGTFQRPRQGEPPSHDESLRQVRKILRQLRNQRKWYG